VVAHRELASSASGVVRELHGITVASASYGITTRIKTYTTAMIVVYAGKDEALERTSSIAK
jgi:hypothetical protein